MTDGDKHLCYDICSPTMAKENWNNVVNELNRLHEENKELKDLLKSMADRNNEIWLNNGQIIRLKKVFKGRMDK